MSNDTFVIDHLIFFTSSLNKTLSKFLRGQIETDYRLDYQLLLGKMSPLSSPRKPRKSGWTRAISFVGLSQSCYRLQIFVWQRLSQKLSHQNRKSFLPCFLDPSHGEAISTARRHRRNSRVRRNTTFCVIVCCE